MSLKNYDAQAQRGLTILAAIIAGMSSAFIFLATNLIKFFLH